MFHLWKLKLKGQLAGRITRTIRDLAEAMGRTEVVPENWTGC